MGDSADPETERENVSSLLRLLTCPVCLESCQPPIYMCMYGHNVCPDCQPALDACPVCLLSGKPSIPNLALDIVSDQLLTLPCKFREQGCPVKRGNQQDLERHFTKCEYKIEYTYSCLAVDGYQYCEFRGTSPSEVFQHVKNEHRRHLLTLREGCLQTYNTRYASHTNLFKWGDDYFWVCGVHLPEKSMFYFYSIYMGPKEHVSNFKLRLTATSKDENANEVSSTKSPLLLEEDFETSDKCMVIGEEYFEKIHGLGRQVYYGVDSIWKC